MLGVEECSSLTHHDEYFLFPIYEINLAVMYTSQGWIVGSDSSVPGSIQGFRNEGCEVWVPESPKICKFVGGNAKSGATCEVVWMRKNKFGGNMRLLEKYQDTSQITLFFHFSRSAFMTCRCLINDLEHLDVKAPTPSSILKPATWRLFWCHDNCYMPAAAWPLSTFSVAKSWQPAMFVLPNTDQAEVHFWMASRTTINNVKRTQTVRMQCHLCGNMICTASNHQETNRQHHVWCHIFWHLFNFTHILSIKQSSKISGYFCVMMYLSNKLPTKYCMMWRMGQQCALLRHSRIIMCSIPKSPTGFHVWPLAWPCVIRLGCHSCSMSLWFDVAISVERPASWQRIALRKSITDTPAIDTIYLSNVISSVTILLIESVLHNKHE